MNFLESKLAQLVALGGLLATIAGVGYTGAGYVQRIEALESQTAVSYEEDINGIKSEMLVINEKLQKLDQISVLQNSVNNHEKDLSLLKQEIASVRDNLENKISNLEEKLKEDKNPLAN
jgi:peptidoglycan hydrolase CwlO-like protein|tara:strand:- start:467 stop:823 length:357 start_codon:yes stop_codon:yes gene_type:complete